MARSALLSCTALLTLGVTAGCGAEGEDGDAPAPRAGTGAAESLATAPTAEPPTCDGPPSAADDQGSTPGEASLPFPTLEHLSVVWEIEGDANENGTVEVRVRKAGDVWRRGLALRRVPAASHEGFSWPNRHAGTIFGLEPGTAYEVELHLSDPDGGCAIRTLRATTRSVPAAAADAKVVSADPSTFAQAAANASPGDVLELEEGSYAGFTFTRDGTPERPIVVRGTEGATIDGEIVLDGRSNVVLEELAVNGQIHLEATESVAVKGSTIRTEDSGITLGTRGENAYIAGNEVEGSTEWSESALGADGNAVGEGILVTGPGHVIEGNRVSGFADGISFLEDQYAVDQFSIDVLRNDISVAGDDAVEADFCHHDCRIVGNRISNSFVGVSSQPGLGGPTYFVRNAMYNVIAEAFKFHRGTIGDVVVHNTVVKNGTGLGVETVEPISRQLYRNNLFIGGPGGTYNGFSSGAGEVVSLPTAQPSVDMDYDGFGTTTGEFKGEIGSTSFSSLAQMRQRTTEGHAVEVGMDVFAADVPYPSAPMELLSVPNLRLAPGSAAVDAGIAIPGLNHGFEGAAPDLGAYEAGVEVPPAGG